MQLQLIASWNEGNGNHKKAELQFGDDARLGDPNQTPNIGKRGGSPSLVY
jgi:hypothetical protein